LEQPLYSHKLLEQMSAYDLLPKQNPESNLNQYQGYVHQTTRKIKNIYMYIDILGKIHVLLIWQ